MSEPQTTGMTTAMAIGAIRDFGPTALVLKFVPNDKAAGVEAIAYFEPPNPPPGMPMGKEAMRKVAHDGDTITAACTGLLRDLCGAQGPHGVITVEHAKGRARVRLPDGGTGVLTFLDVKHHLARVTTQEHRHRVLPVRLLELVHVREG